MKDAEPGDLVYIAKVPEWVRASRARDLRLVSLRANAVVRRIHESHRRGRDLATIDVIGKGGNVVGQARVPMHWLEKRAP